MTEFGYSPIEVHADAVTNQWRRMVIDAWTHSRPGQQVPPLEQMVQLDAQLMDLPSITLRMRIPILMREIILSHRRHTAWVRSTRANRGIENWELYDGISLDTERLEECHRLMMGEVSAGVTQDIYRQWLPLAQMSEMTVQFSFRALIQVLNSCRMMRTQGTKVDTMLLEFELAVKRAVYLYMPLEEMEHTIAPINLLPALPLRRALPQASFVGAGTATLRRSVPIMLRAQIIRHRQIVFADDLLYLMATQDNLLSCSQGMTLKMEMSCSLDGWQHILSQRSCWLVDARLWRQLIKDLENAGVFITPPCGTGMSGVCTVVADHANRIAGTDPGLPCPRALVLHPDQRVTLISRAWSVPDYLAKAREQAEEAPLALFEDSVSDLEANLDWFDVPTADTNTDTDTDTDKETAQ